MLVGVTGATGFVGRYITDRLISEGHEVRAWCRCQPDDPKLDPRVQWQRGSLNDAVATDLLCTGVDAIIHTAVHRESDEFLAEPDDAIAYYEINVLGSLRLLEASRKHKVGKFVFVSSGAVHDRVVQGRPLDETHPLWPSTLYGASKSAVEALVHRTGFSGKLDACTVRPTAIYGATAPIEKSKWYPLLKQIVAGNDVQVRGGSKTVHAADVAQAAILLATTDQPTAGETFNCCDRMISDDEVAEMAIRMTGSKSKRLGERKVAKNQIETRKIESLGMNFGGTELLEQTIQELLDAIESQNGNE